MKRLFAVMLAVLMLTSLTVLVSAEVSPTRKPEYVVEVIEPDRPQNEVTIVPVDDTYHVTPAYPDREFVRFEIEGDYEIISGSLTEPNLVIKPNSDLIIRVIYKDTTTPTAPSSTGNQSPQTGVGIEPWMVIVFAVLVIGAVGAIVATKRMSAKKN